MTPLLQLFFGSARSSESLSPTNKPQDTNNKTSNAVERLVFLPLRCQELKAALFNTLSQNQTTQPPNPAVARSALISDPLHHERMRSAYNKHTKAPGRRASVRCYVNLMRGLVPMLLSALKELIVGNGQQTGALRNTERSMSWDRGSLQPSRSSEGPAGAKTRPVPLWKETIRAQLLFWSECKRVNETILHVHSAFDAPAMQNGFFRIQICIVSILNCMQD